MLINPANLTDESIRIKFESGQGLARCEKQGNTYHISIDRDLIRKNISSTFAKYVELGLLYHEVGHVKYKSFDQQSKYGEIGSYIDNLLEDVRIEYLLSIEHPNAAKFLNLTLNLVTQKITNAQSMNHDPNSMNKLVKQMRDLYNWVRFGIIEKDADMNLINFLIPYSLKATRGSREDCSKCSDLVTLYVLIDNGLLNDQSVALTKTMLSQTQIDSMLDKVDKDSMSSDPQVADVQAKKIKSISKQAKDLEEQLQKDFQHQDQDQTDKDCFAKKIDVGQLIEQTMREAKSGGNYYGRVLMENSDEIKMLTNILSNIITSYKRVDVYDGDINVKRLQDAYLGSLIGEETKSYNQNRIEKTMFDCLIFRDISGSTSSFKFDYFKALVIINEALANLSIRTMIVDFESSARIVQQFDTPKNTANFHVISSGSTYFGSAMNAAKPKVIWKNNRKFGIVITDGNFDDISTVRKLMKEPIYSDVEWIEILIGGNPVPNLANSKRVKNVKELPIVFAEIIQNLKN